MSTKQSGPRDLYIAFMKGFRARCGVRQVTTYDAPDLQRAYYLGWAHGKGAEASCKTVEGDTTHYYRGDSMTGNELLAELRRWCGK